MAWALLALGLVLVVEGLVWALAPRLVENLLAVLRSLSVEERRLAGLGAVALGLALLWTARLSGAWAQ
jgi:uncharacterized protein YjeT (DUF2065 family)